MKKSIIYSALGLGLILTSCNMDLMKPGVLLDSTALTNVENCTAFRNGLYSSMRTLSVGAYVYHTEIQMDQFNGLMARGSGNAFSNGIVTSDNSDVASIYSGVYTRINNVNYFLENVDKLLASGELDADDAAMLARYKGEAKFARAWYYYYLMDHFCGAYSEAEGSQEGKGLSIVTVFNPTGDTSKYPGRSSMDDVLKLINEDLTEAYDALKEFEKTDDSNCRAEAIYLSSYTVQALQARIALWKGDWQTAITKSKAVIANTNYKLADIDNYQDMWSYDDGSELIFAPFLSAAENGGEGYSTCNGWNYYANIPTQSDYIPSNKVLKSYDKNDVRFDAFFDKWNMTISGNKYTAYVFWKFPGNSSMVNGTNFYVNRPKPFRLSEQYLILAEASAESGDVTTANQALNTLRSNRIEGYTPTQYTAQAIVGAVREERGKELIGEGFRMSDLRRWKTGFTRDGEYPLDPSLLQAFVGTGLTVEYTANDYRYVWPIPAAEMDINPQLAGQQNPGY